MDPNQALADAREAYALVNRTEDDAEDHLQALEDLAEAFRALDEWISQGGFLPSEWQYRKGMSK